MLDCRGDACPQPVIRTKALLEETAPTQARILVDNQAAAQNVSRFLGCQGYTSHITPQGSDWLITADRDRHQPAQDRDADPAAYVCAPAPAPAPGSPAGRTVVWITGDTMGKGDDTLGAGLMKNFLATLGEMGPELWRIMFVNAGVKLCCQGSHSLPALEKLAAEGVSILVCGTCLNHFGLLDDKVVGETTNMLDIVTSLQVAGKVVTV